MANQAKLRHPLKTTLWLDQELDELLKGAAEIQGVSMATILRIGGKKEALRIVKEASKDSPNLTRRKRTTPPF